MVQDVTVGGAVITDGHAQRVAEERDHGLKLAGSNTVRSIDVKFGGVAAIRRGLRRT